MQRIVVARFRNRGQAKDYLRVLQRLSPAANYVFVFDPPDRDLTNAIGAASNLA